MNGSSIMELCIVGWTGRCIEREREREVICVIVAH